MLWSAWYDEVLPDCPGVGQAFASQCIRAAAIEFFEESRAWQETSDAMNAVANQADYAFVKTGVTDTIPGEMIVDMVDVQQVWWKGGEIDPFSRIDLIAEFQNWPTQTGQPEGFLCLAPDKITLAGYPTASEAGVIKATAILKPTRSATGITDARGREYFDAIAYGAKARIQSSPGKPFTEMNAAARNRQKFEDEIAKHCLKATMGKNRSAMRRTTRFF